MLNRRFFLGTMSAAALSGCISRAAEPKKPKYVFLMIGDGMGTNQRKIADRYARTMLSGQPNGLVMNQLPVSGITTTEEVNGKTPDSAAAGTSLACGIKTARKVVGLTHDDFKPVRSVAEEARDKGMKVGIVTDVPVDHATPACFYAKVKKREQYFDIDQALAKSNFDYIAGEPMLGRTKSTDPVLPQDVVRNAGYRMVEDRAGFDALKPGCGKVLVEQSIPYNIEGRPEISLEDLTRKGIELLDNNAGFFMMVEGGKIDWCGHANDLLANIHETLSFDRAVNAALEFCKKHPEDSLLIVTADHECGDLQLRPTAFSDSFRKSAAAQKHQAETYVNQLKLLRRKQSSATEEVLTNLLQQFGLEDADATQQAKIQAELDAFFQGKKSVSGLYGKRNGAVVSCLHQVAEKAGASWKSFNHTAAPVKTTAYGYEAALFGGQHDNTDIGLQLKRLIATI